MGFPSRQLNRGAAAIPSSARSATTVIRIDGFYTLERIMSMKKTLTALGFVLALTCAWWFFPRPRPPILLITIDTLRPDRLGAYGNRSVETSNLDRLARDGITFVHALATVPLTLPSHAS